MMADSVWIIRGSYYAVRWSEWLDKRRAPDLSQWAEKREERDPRRDCETVAYRVPSMVPPLVTDDEAREAVYDLIRCRLAVLKRVA